MSEPLPERRATDNKPCADYGQRIAMTEKSVGHMERTMEAVSTKLDLILAQITKVAILEEKHNNLIIDNDRAHKKIVDVADKLDKLAEESRAFMNFTKGQNKILWAVGATVFALWVKVLFFAAGHGMTP